MSLCYAHSLHRQAEKEARRGHLDKAIACHKEAAGILHNLLETVVQEKARKSIELQEKFHLRERRLLEDYQRRCDELAINLQHLRLSMADNEAIMSGFGQQKRSLQQNIYKTFEETESLLDRLKEEERRKTDSLAASGTKRPKDDKETIEELEVANTHLRRMVDSLFVELDQCQRENSELKERIREMEEQMRLGRHYSMPHQQQQEPLPYISGGGDMLQLAPLEVPKFDFEQKK